MNHEPAQRKCLCVHPLSCVDIFSCLVTSTEPLLLHNWDTTMSHLNYKTIQSAHEWVCCFNTVLQSKSEIQRFVHPQRPSQRRPSDIPHSVSARETHPRTVSDWWAVHHLYLPMPTTHAQSHLQINTPLLFII